MRQIKFRAWDKETKKIIDTGFHLLGETTAFGLVEDWLRKNNPSQKSSLERLNDVVIQQFTGLTDKNGKEIYEGDFLLLPDEYTKVILDDGTGPTEPDNHVAEVMFSEDWSAFGVSVKESSDYIQKGFNTFNLILGDMGKDYIIKECEIVGNVFENADWIK